MSATSLHAVHVICTDAFAGAERSVVLTARALAERGHRVEVVGGEPATMRSLLEGSGVAWHEGATIAAAARTIARLGRPDLVHAHMTAAELAAVVTVPFHRAHLVVTRHFAQHRGASTTGRVASAVINRIPRTEVAISQFVADHLECPSVIVTHGIEDEPVLAGTGTDVVVVQRLEAEKQTAVALEAWARSGLAAEGRRLVIAGDGAERAELERRARTLGVAESVEFLGRVADVRAVRARGAVQLATPPAEPFGLSVLEAMAVGLPVVAAEGGAHRELLAEHGRYFPPGDAAAAADALVATLAAEPERVALGAALRARQQEHFSLAAHGAALEAVYRSALARRRRD